MWIDTDTDLGSYHNGNVWGDSALGTCYEINSGGPGGPPIDPATLFPDEFSSGEVLTACECCEQDLREYNICEEAAGVTCDAFAQPILLIDVALVPGWDAITYANIVGEETGTGIQCCYTLSENKPECQAPDGTIISTVSGCEDEACNLT